MAIASCSGNIDPDEGKSEDPIAPFTLSVDKEVIESDGKDEAVLTITDAEGKVLTDPEHIRKTSFNIKETNVWQSGLMMDRPNVFTSIKDGTYTISAMYDGKACSNEVKVTSKNRSSYEKFHKNVLIYRFTATWCAYCPDMTEALSNVNEYTKNHSIVMEMHYNDEFAIDALEKYAGDVYQYQGFPYCRYSLAEGSGDRAVNDIQALVEKQLVEYPAQTAIKASSSISGNTLKVDASVTASSKGTFDLGMAVLKDNCIPASSEAYETVYNDVVLSISGNYYGMSADGSFTLEADDEKKITREWTNDILSSDEAKDCRVVLFTLAKYGDKVVIDNAVTFKVGEGVAEYRGN